MRILALNYEFPPLGGGAATVSSQVSRHLARSGAEVVVLTSGFRDLPAVEQHDGYQIRRVPVWRKALDRCSVPEMGSYLLSSVRPALRLVDEFKPDLLHVYFGMPVGPIALVVKQLRGVPYLLSLQGGDVPGFMGRELMMLHGVTKPLTMRVWAGAGCLIANSQGLHDLAQRSAPHRTINIVPNGVDIERFQPRPEQRDAGGKVRLFFAGRLASQKGLPYFLQALAALEPALRATVEVELAGSGPEEARLKELTKQLGLDATVRFSGWLSREEIVDRYSRADLFVLPSLDEGMPVVLLEAMASGAAILATAVNGSRELVKNGQNGLLVEAGNSAALADALRTLLADADLRARMGRQSRELALQYDWSHIAARYLELSEQMLGTRRANRRNGAEIKAALTK